MKLGLISDSLRLDFPSSIKKASELGVSGVQKYLTGGEFSAENMTKDKIREIKDIMSSNGIVFSAICGDFGLNLDDPTIVDKSKRVLDAAKELGCDIVTTHIGHLTVEDSPFMEAVRKNARELAEYADSMNSYFAAETGTEKAPVMKAFLDSLGAKGMRVNYDPANLVMVAGDDPVAGVYTLKRLYSPYSRQGRHQDGRKELPRGSARHRRSRFRQVHSGSQRYRLYGISHRRARGRRRPCGGHSDGCRFPA